MTRNSMIIAAGSIALLAGSAFGQTITAIGGNAQFTYNVGAVPTTAPVGTLGGGASNLDINGAGAGGDQLFENWWYYRVDGVDTREIRYNAAANPFVAAGDVMTGTFNFANFRSDLRYQIFDTDAAGVAQARLEMTNTITNTSASTRTYNIYSYGDLDPNGSFTHPYSYNGAEQAFTGSSGGVTVWSKGFGANAYQAAPFTTTSGVGVRGGLADGDIDNLNNTVTGSPGDFSGAFQWTFALAPGASFSILSVLSVNTLPIPTPGALALFGFAGLAAARRRRA